jgi:hypothetical protein
MIDVHIISKNVRESIRAYKERKNVFDLIRERIDEFNKLVPTIIGRHISVCKTIELKDGRATITVKLATINSVVKFYTYELKHDIALVFIDGQAVYTVQSVEILLNDLFGDIRIGKFLAENASIS